MGASWRHAVHIDNHILERPMPTKVLMILTSHAKLGGTDHATGVWFEELATPYWTFADTGTEVDIVSIHGGAVPIDPRSRNPLGENDANVDRFLRSEVAMAKIGATPAVDTVDWREYDAIFLPGGHGTMWDLPESAGLAKLLGEAFDDGRVIAAVCHGPAGLVTARTKAGAPIVAGKRVSAFTNAEEEAAGLTAVVPFLLETRLRELGGQYESGPDFQPFAVADGLLVTGQNPASSALVAQKVLDAVRLRAKP
jgi:putative intracellular protease/amidase